MTVEDIIKEHNSHGKRMIPVKLTSDNDYLIDYDSGHPKKDTAELSCCIGMHQNCRGCMDIRETTETNKVITCRACYLRIVIPKRVKTYEDLRYYFEAKMGEQNNLPTH